jgi:hypothetical protein
MVVVMNLVAQAHLQLLNVSESVQVKELGLERAEEALHGSVVRING